MGRGHEQREVAPGDMAPSEGRAPGSASACACLRGLRCDGHGCRGTAPLH